MKCPKCGYLGFEHVERCRNCGYDFSLTHSTPAPDLSIRPSAADERPLEDLSILDRAMASAAPGVATAPDLDRVLGAPAAPPLTELAGGVRLKPPRNDSAGDLPLFGAAAPGGDEPLITRASPPRPPLAVRRATPDVARARADQTRSTSLDLSLEADHGLPLQARVDPARRAQADSWSRDDSVETAEDAAVGARVVAVVIDLVILALIDAIVIYFTMKICGITLVEIGLLPKAPLLAFLFVQNGGYLVAFTAGGQTLGKMAAGIRVVPADADSPLDVGRAFIRTLMWVVLAIPAGLGFLTAVLSRDHRGLHDRFAGTRVVR